MRKGILTTEEGKELEGLLGLEKKIIPLTGKG
jgi:hypothetical protein